MRETRLIARDLRGTRFRTLAVVVSVAVLVSLLFSTSVLNTNAQNASQSASEKFGADMMLLPPLLKSVASFEIASGPIFVVDPSNDYLNGSVVAVLSLLSGIAATSPQLYVATLNSSRSKMPVSLIAYDPKSDFVIRPWVSYQEDNLQSNEAIAGAGAGFSVGEELRVGQTTLNIVAVLSPTNSSLDRTVVFPIGTAYSEAGIGSPTTNITRRTISGVLLKLTQNAVKNVLESEIQNAVYSFKLVEASGLVSRVRVDTNGISSYEVVAEIMMGASVLVLMASVFSMTSNERNRQLGLLRSLGATKGFIFRNALLEAGLMALVGGVFGLIVGNLVVMFGETFLVATFNIHLIQPTFLEALTLSVTSVALGILVGTAASTLPAYRVSSGDPYDAIRKGE